MDPLTSEIAIPEPENEEEAQAEHDLASTAEESPTVSTSEPETSYTTEVIPAAIDHSILAESGIHDDGNAVNLSKTMELQSELEPRATEAEHMPSPVEDTSTKLEGHGTAENIEAKDYVDKEVDLTYFS